MGGFGPSYREATLRALRSIYPWQIFSVALYLHPQRSWRLGRRDLMDGWNKLGVLCFPGSNNTKVSEKQKEGPEFNQCFHRTQANQTLRERVRFKWDAQNQAIFCVHNCHGSMRSNCTLNHWKRQGFQTDAFCESKVRGQVVIFLAKYITNGHTFHPLELVPRHLSDFQHSDLCEQKQNESHNPSVTA